MIAEQEWKSLPDETRRLVTAFSNGINALIQDSEDKLPIEFDLLGYRPLPWRPVDSLAIACAEERRWAFLLTVAPLVLRRGTASPVNPIAVF